MLFHRYPEPFTAYFLSGSDPEFRVLPQAGELLPAGTAGTHITVGFKPRMYSKKHKATLVIQVSLSECDTALTHTNVCTIFYYSSQWTGIILNFKN